MRLVRTRILGTYCAASSHLILLRLDLAACGLRRRRFLLIFVFPSAALSRYPRAPLISMNERAARHEVILSVPLKGHKEKEKPERSV